LANLASACEVKQNF